MAINYLKGLLDLADSIHSIGLLLANPEDPTDEAAAEASISNELVDFGVPATNAPVIAAICAHALEAAANGTTGQINLTQDVTNELSNHHISLPVFLQGFLLMAIQQGATQFQALRAGKK